LNESNALWHDLLTHRCGLLEACFLQNEALEPNVKTSIWWREVTIIGGVCGCFLIMLAIFWEMVFFTICFLKEKWLSLDPLEVIFLSLFAKTTAKDAVIAKMGYWAVDE
jgi:hypothetical protein